MPKIWDEEWHAATKSWVVPNIEVDEMRTEFVTGELYVRQMIQVFLTHDDSCTPCAIKGVKEWAGAHHQRWDVEVDDKKWIQEGNVVCY